MAAIRTKFIDKASASVPQYRDTSAKLLKKLSERGFAVLRLEDPDTAALKNLFTEAATFLGKPAFDKEAHSADPDDDDQQLADAGYRVVKSPEIGARKESFEFRDTEHGGSAARTGPGEEFEAALADANRALHTVAISALRAIARSSEGHSAALDTFADDTPLQGCSSSSLMVSRYIKTKPEKKGGPAAAPDTTVCPPHKDRGLFTLVTASSAKGSDIEIFDTLEQQWAKVAANVQAGTAVLLVGHTLARTTTVLAAALASAPGGTNHRVTAEPIARRNVATRDSIVYRFRARPEATLADGSTVATLMATFAATHSSVNRVTPNDESHGTRASASSGSKRKRQKETPASALATDAESSASRKRGRRAIDPGGADHIYQPSPSIAAAARSDETFVNIRVLGVVELRFKTKRSTPMRKLKAAFCKQTGIDATSIGFFFDGEQLGNDVTPDMMAMEDEDTINVIYLQSGD